MRSRKDFYSVIFQFFKSVYIYIFDLNGDGIKAFSEIVNGVKIVDISTSKMMAKMCGRAIWIIFQNKSFNRIIDRSLEQHTSKLAASKDADFLHGAKIGLCPV